VVFKPVIEDVPDDFEVKGERDFTATIQLAESEDGYQKVAVDVRLLRAHWRGVEVHTLQFPIAVENERTGEGKVIWERDEAAPYVECVRPLVMKCVKAAVGSMLGKVHPSVIHMVTAVSEPDDNLLPKYHMITDTVAQFGYDKVMDCETDSDGHKFWLLVEHGDD